MAPILATASGVPATMAAEELRHFLSKLGELPVDITEESQIKALVAVLPSEWPYEEQVDLHEWIHPLNAMDSALDWILKNYKMLLLASDAEKQEGAKTTEGKSSNVTANYDLPKAPASVQQYCCAILQFTAVLLRHCTSKQLYASVEHVSDLLAAESDEIAAACTKLLCALSIPPALHKQQAPEHSVHTTALHTNNSNSTTSTTTSVVNDRLHALSVCIPTNNSEASADHAASDSINFCYYVGSDEPVLKEIAVTAAEMLSDDAYTSENSDDTASKRRKVADTTKTKNGKKKSTAELFQLAVEKAGGLDQVPEDQRFSLLAACRRISGATRLEALVACIHTTTQQQQQVVKQDTVCGELVDLLRPVVSEPNAIAATVNDNYETRMLAIEALTALVSRRESGHRVSGVLTELGVGKGQYLGLLPTLIRYSLASLGTVLDEPAAAQAEDEAFGIGLAFVNATKAPPLPRVVQVDRALQFIDNVLTLTSAVIGTPSGTSSLVDCGLIPALLTTVSMKPAAATDEAFSFSTTRKATKRINSLLRFVTAQAVQILEGALVTHNNALTAFHDLHGVEILTTRLSREVMLTKKIGKDADGDVEMTDNAVQDNDIVSSQRVLLFSVVNCLTVVIQQETSNSAVTPSGAVELRKKEVTESFIIILDDIKSYGGHVASLVATLLSDVMNADPHVVHYVHKCGIAESFLKMVIGKALVGPDGKTTYEPIVPPTPELLIVIPNVLAALALTESGAKAVAERNPFPSLLRLLYHPDYAMPRSRCLLSELTSIVGTGLDEIMRHVDNLRPLVLSAIVNAMKAVAATAQDLESREALVFKFGEPAASQMGEIEHERSCLIQYVLNFGQLLEQILHNEDHCEPFVAAGGLDALLELYSASMPSSSQFLTYASSLSTPSVSTLHHSTTEESLSASLRCIELRYNPLKMIQKLTLVGNRLLDELDECKTEILGRSSASSFSLDVLPEEPLYKLTGADSQNQLSSISLYLRKVANVQWITTVLANTIKGACQRSSERGLAWSRGEREWKQELSSVPFEKLVGRLSDFHRDSLFEVCRVRTSQDFEQRERERTGTRVSTLRYRLRIVCSEGAVVRDGIEIDSCSSVGSMEMGDIVDSFDRCVNSSGILRYRTRRGWVSEMTRGHGREPIAEVLAMWECASEDSPDLAFVDSVKTRIEAGVPDIRSVAVGVLARGQNSHSDFFGALSKLTIQGIRALPLPVTFEDDDAGSHVASMMNLVARNMMDGLGHQDAVATAKSMLSGNSTMGLRISSSGAAMYLGCMLSHLHLCVFDDKRERRMVNLPLLVLLLASDSFVIKAQSDASVNSKHLDGECVVGEKIVMDKVRSFGTFDAIRFVFKHGLSDFASRAGAGDSESRVFLEPEHQRVGRSVAASLPPLIAFLRKLISTPMSSSPAASIMSRMNWKDVSLLLGKDDLKLKFVGNPKEDSFFHPESFLADLQFSLSRVAKEVWCDESLLYTPPFLVHPIAKLVGELIVVLEDVSKKKSSWSQPRPTAASDAISDRMRLSDLMRRRQADAMETEVAAPAEEFEASADSILRLTEMGFSRDHALDALESTRSNRVETAMDYALSSDPPSPATIERRRVEREERAQRRAQQQAQEPPQNEVAAGEGAVEGEPPGDDVAPVVANEEETQAMETDEQPKTGDEDKKENAESATRNALAKTELTEWIDVVPKVACQLLDRMPRPSARRARQTSGRLNSFKKDKDSDGDGEAEALTVVLSSFMLELCHRNPDKRTEIVSQVLIKLKSNLLADSEEDGAGYCVSEDAQASVSALCHAAVLITRALPKTRLLVLKQGLVRSLVSCIGSSLASPPAAITEDRTSLPMWLAPALLLLDIMSQPIVAFSDEKMVTSILEDSPDSEFAQVQSEHKEQVSELFQMANRWLSVPPVTANDVGAKDAAGSETQTTAMDVDSTPSSTTEVDEAKPGANGENVSKSHFSSVPAYFPLLPSDSSQTCLDICQKLLCKPNEAGLSPGVAQSTLLLLLRLLRTPKVSSLCLQIGTAEAILALPKECKFTGNTGLVTLIFRRILEDGATLQSAMETEIRGAVTKLHAKKNPADKTENPRVSLESFIEAVTPLLCRDPATFFKAMIVSVVVQAQTNKKESTMVALLTPAERAQRVDLLVETNVGEATSVEDKKEEKSSNGSKSRSKSPHKGSRRRSHSKKGRKGDHAKVSVTDSPASHVTGLLINSVVTATNAASLEDEAEDGNFLWTGNQLEILADLALAVPACASAVHNFRPHRCKDKSKRLFSGSQIRHALCECPPPPKTFVTFLLHALLPQDRWSIRNDPQLWIRQKDLKEEEAPIVTTKKKKAARVLKVSQTAARVLIALVVRPGEGRKRVIADLSFALSGGRLGHGASMKPGVQDLSAETKNSELHALHAWGELCLGIAAPRSNSKNIEGIASLSVENVRLMLENGMVHALLYALHRVRVFHPMASNTYGSLLLPLEVLTRANVFDAVKILVDKGKQPREGADKGSSKATPSDPMEDEAIQDVARLDHDGLAGVGYDMLGRGGDSEMDDSGSQAGGVLDEGANDAASDDEDEGPTSEESGGEEESDEGSDDDMDEDGSDDEDLDESSSDEVEEEGGWDVDYNNSFPTDGADVRQDHEVDDEVTEQVDENVDEGWTRIESTGFGGMLLGGRQRREGGGASLLTSQNAAPGRSRGFIDAAEAMIGTLLRSGEISSDAVAEIEGQLGIRIMQGGRSLRANLRAGSNESADALGVRVLGMDSGRSADRRGRGDAIGTLPHIQQRSQPEVSYSAFGRNGQWVEVSSMEYVYGGPSVSGSSRNYDIISPFRGEADPEDQVPLTHLDLQIFPGGPASAASARAQHSLHPLLCGVDLPPPNSLVSDILPHGVRATRRGQMTTRRPGDWTNASMSHGGYLVSTSTGNLVRSNRTHSGAALGSGIASQTVAGPVGWTDDGLPVDATVEEFSSALETALDDSARATLERNTPQAAPNATAADNAATTASVAAANGSTTNAVQAVAGTGDSGGDHAQSAVGTEAPTQPTDGAEPSGPEEAEAPSQNGEDQESPLAHGDIGASSLVAGLRLSPGSEPAVSVVAAGTETSAPAGPAAEPERSDTDHNAGILESSTAAVGENMNDQSQRRDESTTGNSAGGLALAEEGMEDAGPAGASDQVDQRTQGAAGAVENDDPVAEDSTNNNGLVCPPDIDLEVFNSLPREMQQDCVDQYTATQDLAAQLDGSSLDPDVLAALPEEMRREVIEQERQDRRMREEEQAPANPAHAEEMDNASFIASLAPDLREEILLTADETFLNSLPPGIVAEAQILRERASVRHRGLFDGGLGGGIPVGEPARAGRPAPNPGQHAEAAGMTTRRRQRSGKFKVETDRPAVVYFPESLPAPIAISDLKALIRLMYLLSPIRPPRLLQKLFLNLCANPALRSALSTTFIKILHEDGAGALASVESFEGEYQESDTWRRDMDKLFSKKSDFPPSMLVGSAPEPPSSDVFNLGASALQRRRHGLGAAASMTANLPKGASRRGSTPALPPAVAARIVDTVLQLCKSPRFCLHTLVAPLVDDVSQPKTKSTCFEKLLELLDKPLFSKNSANLDQLLTMLESAVSPLSHMSKHTDDEVEISQRDSDAAAAVGKEYVDVPRVVVSQSRLQLLCSILRMETCRDTAFAKVNTIVRRLCRVEMNRGYVLAELASVAHALGADALRDLRALRIRMETAVSHHQEKAAQPMETDEPGDPSESAKPAAVVGTISSSVTLSTSTSELKLLRVLQTLQALCNDSADDHSSKKNEGSVIVTEELVHLLRQMQFDDLWDELSSCLKVVQILEGVKSFEEEEQKASEDDENNDEEEADGKAKKLRNSAAGLLTRFLPSIEAFFVANASATRPADSPAKEGETKTGGTEDISLENLVGGKRMFDFATSNRVLLNALVRNNPGLLDKGLRALVQVPRCRVLLDFDVKRQWFKTQVRRLRQQASRRHGSLRLHIRRKYVFEDAYHQLQPRNADEMRGRLHVTFRNEEGVDAGGLSREFFGILAKEMFNPNYALFTSTEDGCTFQPNPNSLINPDHLSYFRFVGRVVGKAVVDGFLLDAHFTRSLYKHMIGVEPTHHDMEAIDPDYYRNLKTILEYNLSDIGLDLTFSTEDNSFGRSQVIDLIPDGRTIPVTEERKEEYVRLVCQHRMTTAIQSQIKSYLAGFYELVSPELIAIFTPKEVELLISGLPDIDVHDFKKHTDYQGWKATDKEIEWFWNILFSLSRNEKAAFLQFVTGSSKVPLAGFSELQGMRGIQKFSIHKAGGTKGALMSAHTCFNSLDLPVYSSEEEMREKLLYAINEGGGAFMFA